MTTAPDLCPDALERLHDRLAARVERREVPGLAALVARGDDAGEPPVPWGFGWDGGTGTTWRSDPVRGLTGILLTQRATTSPRPPPLLADFWDAAYAAVGAP